MKTLNIHFLSDWHIGEGSGQPGNIDKLIRRHPQDRLPYVPAKTITGIWRDACEQIAVALDNSDKNNFWQNWLTILFGDQPNERSENQPNIKPIPAALTIRAARFPKALRQSLLDSPPLQDALTFIKPSTQIDRQTGQTIDDHLHFDEVVRAGAVLESQIVLDNLFTEEHQKIGYALLWAGAKAVERLGGKRRRGLGRCQFQFDGITKEEALKILKQEKLPPAPKQPSQNKIYQFNAHLLQREDFSADWMQVPLYLTLKSPILVPKGEIGNVITGLDYIPGTYLLGAITELLQKKLKSSDLNLFPYVANGDIQISNAYLKVGESRGLPIPMALFHQKETTGLNNKDGHGGNVWNRLEESLSDTEQNAQLKQHRQGYIIPYGEQTLPCLFTTPLQLTTHGTIEDKWQRPTEEVGGVFSFEAIKSGTCLQSVLKIRRGIVEQLPADWWEILNTDICLGKSKKDDYGWVELRTEACETMLIPPMQHDTHKLMVWLCSDVLLRDAHLRPSTNITDLKKEIEKQLKVELKPRQSNDDILSALTRTTRTDGWHQQWGLPRPSYIGLAAGSCIVFESQTGTLDKNKLEEIMQNGLGERRAEGFGEVHFNPPLLMGKTSAPENYPIKEIPKKDTSKTSANSYSPKKENVQFSKETEDFVKILEITAWRKDIQQAALALSAETKKRHDAFGWNSDSPPNSQLGALRTNLTRMQTWEDGEQVQDWLNHLCNTSNRRDKWTNNALKKIDSLLEEPELIWQQLQASNRFPTIRANAKTELEKELWAEAVRTLFAIAIRYEQRERE